MIALAAHSRPIASPDAGELMSAVVSEFASFALDCLETAVFVLDSNSRIHFTSAAARRLLDDNRLYARNGQSFTRIVGDATALRHLVHQSVDRSSIGPAQMTVPRFGDVENALRPAVVAINRSSERHPALPIVM